MIPGVVILTKEQLRRKRGYDKKRDVVDRFKAGSCTDCNATFRPHVMQFDHVFGMKEFNIGSSLNNVSMARLLNEIRKCELVCANCHAERTYHRRIDGKQGDESSGSI